jgi:hypothetical protein
MKLLMDFCSKLYDLFSFVLKIYLYICQFNVLMDLLYTANKIKWAGHRKIEKQKNGFKKKLFLTIFNK